MIHRHKYDRPVMKFSPPVSVRVRHASDELAYVTMFGLTTVTQICTECGKATSYIVPGDARE